MRRRPTATAALAVLVFVVGQLAALAHEAESRHVTCAQHGEELEVANLGSKTDNCGQAHWVSVDGKSGEHQDCAIARLLRTSTQASHVAVAPIVIDVVAKIEPQAPVARAYSVDVLLIAPKTSPPV